MATTATIQAYYSSAYKVLPQKALPLGTPSAAYEPIQQSLDRAGQPFLQFFQAVIPVGFGWASATNFDYLNLCQVGGNYPNTANNTVVPGFRIKSLAISSSGNAGNNVLSYIGFATANTIIGTGSALQGGALTGTPIGGATHNILNAAVNEASQWVGSSGTGINGIPALNPGVLTAGDTLVLAPIAAVNLTTTAINVFGYLEYYLTGPTGY